MLVLLPGVVDGFGKFAGDRACGARRSVRLIACELIYRYGSRAIRRVRALGRLREPLGQDFFAGWRGMRNAGSGCGFLPVESQFHVRSRRVLDRL
jgi:hypothetical protein